MYRRVPVCSPMIGYKLHITCSAATARYFQPTTALCFFLHKSMELSRNDDRLWVRGAREIPLAARENIFPAKGPLWRHLPQAQTQGPLPSPLARVPFSLPLRLASATRRVACTRVWRVRHFLSPLRRHAKGGKVSNRRGKKKTLTLGPNDQGLNKI